MTTYRQALRESWSRRRFPPTHLRPSPTTQPTRPGPRDRLRAALVEQVLQAAEQDGGFDAQGGLRLRARVRDVMERTLRDQQLLRASEAERAELEEIVIAELRGLGPLEPLMADPTVSDVLVNGPYEIWADRFGRLEPTPLRFDDEGHLLRLLARVVSSTGRHLEEATPYVDARLPDGSRLHAMIPPLSESGPVLAIRKRRRIPLQLEDLIAVGTLSPEMGRFLGAAVQAGLSILVAGGASAGKTTLLSVLSRFIPPAERMVTIEETAELCLAHHHVVSLEARQPNIEGRGEVTLRTLVRNALRMRADRIIVGEVRGGEVFDMLQAMNVGHDGSMTTVHANSPDDALRRLETLVLLGGFDLPRRAVEQLVGAAFDLVVQVERFLDGTRRITHVCELEQVDGQVRTRDIFRFDLAPGPREGTARGEHHLVGPAPRRLDRLLAADPAIGDLWATAGEAPADGGPRG